MGNFVAFLAALFALLSDLNGAQVGMSITYAVQVAWLECTMLLKLDLAYVAIG